MKDNARMNDYLLYLEEQFNDAKMSGEKSLILTAKDVHNTVSSRPTLPTCCAAMKKIMKVGDEILSEPATKTGFGGSLRIQYMLEDREEREVKFPPLKRGRKAVNTPHDEKELKKLKKLKKEDEGLEQSIKEWLDEMQVTYQVDGNKISVDGAYGKWMIIMDLPKKGPKLSFSGKIYELLSEADESYEKYSLAINSNITYEMQWKKLSDTIKHKLYLTLLKVTPKNKVKEI